MMIRGIASLPLLMTLSATCVVAQDFSNVTSGMLLGVYATARNDGMQVTNTIPGYSAVGRLFPGDVLLQTTVDGFQVYPLRSHYEMEHAKMAIGPNREAAVEFWRPGVGLMYAWVEFTPIYAPAAPAMSGGFPQPRMGKPQQRQFSAQFKLESEKPGARALFQKRGPNGVRRDDDRFNRGPQGRPNPVWPGQAEVPRRGASTARDLFR